MLDVVENVAEPILGSIQLWESFWVVFQGEEHLWRKLLVPLPGTAVWRVASLLASQVSAGVDLKAASVGTSCLRSSVAGVVASWTDYGSMSFILNLRRGCWRLRVFPNLGKRWHGYNKIFYFLTWSPFESPTSSICGIEKTTHRALKCHFSNPSEILVIFKMLVSHLPSRVLFPKFSLSQTLCKLYHAHSIQHAAGIEECIV